MKTKYPISKDFKPLTVINAPMNRFAFKAGNALLNIPTRTLRSSRTLSVKRITVAARNGADIPSYVIRTKTAEKNRPCIIFYHGGGFVFKGSPHHTGLAKLYALKTECTVFYVDYRLAYDAPYLAPENDCLDAYRNITEHGSEYGIDTSKIITIGDSAGGYLALCVALGAIENALIPPKLQMLIYPVVDSEQDTESMKLYTDTPLWNAKNNKKMWDIYQKGNKLPRIIESPLLCYMPKTYIETAEFDCLRDEGRLLSEKLKTLGADVTLIETKRTIHGFDAATHSKITREMISKRLSVIAEIISTDTKGEDQNGNNNNNG